MEAQLRRVCRDGDQGDPRDADHQHRLERKIGRVQETERGAGVLHVRDVQESGDDRHVIVEVERPPDDFLRQLIEADH